MQEVRITVSTDGEQVTVEAVGFKGQGCRVTEALEQAMGAVQQTTLKPEYRQQADLARKVGR